jgi:hypothetical protein
MTQKHFGGGCDVGLDRQFSITITTSMENISKNNKSPPPVATTVLFV